MGPGDVFGLLIALTIPSVVFIYLFNRFFRLRERKMELEAIVTAEKAAQYAASNAELEQRVRVLEQIVTDGGAQTAAQIEALRAPRLTGEKAQ